MAGLKMKWINDTNVNNPVVGNIAKPAYRVWGAWAFAKNQRWLNFLTTPSRQRLGYMADTLRAFFADGDNYSGADNINPRIIILHSAPPADLSEAGVAAYHAKHEMTIHEDGDTYSMLMFKGNPATMPFDYIKELIEDENEGLSQDKIDKRAYRFFTMMLITKCR